MRHPLADTSDASARLPGRLLTGVLVVVVGVAALVTAGPAAAHDALIGSDPADGAVLAAVPTQVVLQFAASQADLGAEVVVTGADGQSWSDGAPVVADATVTQALLPGMPNGPYTVTWRSVAGDGHPVTGVLGFTVDAPAPTPTPTPELTSTPTAPASGDDATASVEPTDDAAGPGTAQEAGQGAGPWPWALAAGVAALMTAAVLAVRRRGVSHE